jgi:hypothetical protein
VIGVNERLRHQLRGRRTRPAAALVCLVLVIAIVSAVVAVSARRGSAEPTGPANRSHCRQPALAHVHDPARLTVLSDCVVVSGTVRSTRLDSAYDDNKAEVAVDRQFVHFLKPANRGLLVVDVIATDLATVQMPAAGQHATFYGAWVVNKGRKAVELHPTWRIETSPASTGESGPQPRDLHAGQKLELAVQAPTSVPVGSGIVANVAATWAAPARHVSGQKPVKTAPASQLRLFVEATDAQGQGVRWRAKSTNTLGQATFSMLALHVPGGYRLTVYAVGKSRGEAATKSITVKR